MNLNFSLLRKKGLLFAPIIGLLFLIHLIWVYIYEGGESMWVRGGSINIGIIGTSPNIPNPLEYTKDKYHDLILKFLFRPLIRYDAIHGEYQGDIGTCDISNLSKISCTLKNDQLWSDGTAIQVEDVLSTYQAFRDNAGTDKMGVFLKNVSFISRGEGKIEITAKEKNSMILDLLTYPIVRSDMLERIRTGRITKDLYLTSGPYQFIEYEKDEENGYERITIMRDEKNNGEWWLDKYHFLFFPDIASLERSIDTLSVVIPPIKNENLFLGPRFDAYEYALYEYIGLFANTDTLSTEMRRQLYGKIEETLSGKIDPTERPLSNIFGYGSGIENLKLEKNLSDVMREIGYTKPDQGIAELNRETWLLTGSSIDYGNTRHFSAPTKKQIHFSEAAAGFITLSGDVPVTTSKVYINGYELKEYRPGNTRFTYRVSVENGTLTEGKNVYALELEDTTGNRDVRDTLTIYYSTDEKKLSSLKQAVDDVYLAELNTPEKVAERLKKVQSEKERLSFLDPRYYYNSRWEVYSLKIAYKDDPQSLEKYATYVSTALESLSIQSELVPLGTKDIQNMLEKWEKDYDYIIIGFEASGRLSRIGQVFLSTEAKNGINFAKIESKKLDGLFAELRVASLQTETESIQKQILDYMQSEWFFLSLSSPLHTLYIDKNLKWVKKVDTFQDIATLHSVLGSASIKDTYVITTEWKSFFWFFSWIWHKAFL